MADENIVTNIVAKSDFSNLIADLHKVSYSLTSLQDKLIATNKTLASQVGVMNRSFAETLRSTGQYSTRFVSLTSDVDKFGNQLEKGQMKLSKFFNVYGQHAKTSGGLIRDLARQQVQLQNAIMQPLGKNAEGLMQYNVHIPRGLDAVKNKTAIARQELQIMNKVVQQGAGQLINWGKNTQWAGRQLTVGLTVPLVAFGKASADAFKQADEQLVRLTKVYGGVAQTSARDLAKIRADVSKTATDLSKSYGASFKDTLSLAADIAATGKQGDDLLGSLRETTRLSVLGEVDKQDAMKATLAIQSAFKQNTEELTESINFLNAVENQTSTTLNDLVEAIPKAGPIIRGLGGSIQDLALYLTAMREGGINASEGANALKSGLASLINPTKVAKGMFQDLGISLENIVNKNAGNTTATILELQSALETLNPLQKQQALEQLFGKFQFARMNALFENLGKQGSQTLQVMDLMKASSQDLASLADRELGQVTESASGKYRRAVEGLRADLAGIGNQFLTINANLINFVDGVIKFVQQLPGPIKQALGFFGMLTAVAGPLIMLTGVLGNFFGYIIKGAYHFKSLFKGGEGWKLLTPEILAAQKAGALVETTFYSDAKAAAVLKQSINELALSYANLQQKASMAATSTNPAVRTAAGNLIMTGGGQRQGDPNNPMTGKRDTRDFSHINPVGQMSPVQKQNQTIFGVLPGSEAVNARISNNPQMYMNQDMPKIPGLTTINGVSTGIVSAEAAKWHSMTGALAMQSQAEIKLLKAEVAQTGLITHELSTSYQALLPEMTRLTTLAATKSQAIVAQLQAGKISVDQAMIRIRALNFEIEAMMGQAATQVAAAQGRNINLTGVPLLNQAVVGPDGKSNFKELSRPGRTRGLLSTIAARLGVKTYGAGYSMETTIPKKMAYGGSVPGSGNTDTVPAMLTPGEFVINKEATAANLPLLQAINGPGSNGPMYSMGSNQAIYDRSEPQTSGLSSSQVSSVIPGFKGKSNFYTLKGTSGLYIGDVTDPGIVGMFGDEQQKAEGKISRISINSKMKTGTVPGRVLAAAIRASGSSNRGSTEQFLNALANNGIISTEQASKTSNLLYNKYLEILEKPSSFVSDKTNNYWQLADSAIKTQAGNSREVSHLWDQFSKGISAHTGDTTEKAGGSGASTSHLAQTLTTTDGKKIKVGQLRGTKGSLFAHAAPPQPFLDRLKRSGLAVLKAASRSKYVRVNRGGIIGMNAGGMVPMPQQIPIPIQNGQYNMGGMVQGYNLGGQVLPIVSSIAGYTGGQKLGSMAGGDMGGMIGSLAGGMLLPAMFSRTSKAVDETVPKLGRFKSAINAIAVLPGPVKLLGGLMAVGAAVKTINDKINEHRRIINLAFGPSEESAAKLGIKYNSLTSQLKDFTEQTKLSKASIEEYYAATQNSGIPGLNLTIKELRELKTTIEKDFPDYIKMFNAAKPDEVVSKASQLKAQLISGGMGAEEATKKIYAMIAVSNKANQSIQALANQGFAAIKDKSTAAIESIKIFNGLLTSGNKDQLATSFDTVVNSIQAAEQALIGTKDAQDKLITSSEAFNIQLEKINNSQLSSVKLGQQGVDYLSKNNQVLALILNKTDSVAGAYSKIKLYLSGIDIDLKSMNNETAILVAQNVELQTQQLTAVDGKYGSIVAKIKEYNTAGSSTKVIKAQQVVQSSLDDQIKKHKKIIDQIKEEADAKIKGLERQNAEEDYNSQIKKLQIQYQDKLSLGDMSGAAQTQIDMQFLSSSRQKDLTKNAIQDKASADVKAQESIIEGLQKKIDGSQATIKKATESADASLKKAAELQTTLNELVLATLNASNKLTETEEKNVANLQDKLKKLGFTDLSNSLGRSGPRIPFADKLRQGGSFGIENIAKDSLSQVIDGNKTLKTEDKELIKYFRGESKFKESGMVKANVTSTTKLGKTVNTIDPTALYNAGIQTKPGTEFTDKSGNQWKIDRNDPTNRTVVVSKAAAGGYIKHYGAGSFGSVRGPGTGTSDSIPAYLSNGEYVLRASAVRAMGVPMLDEINKMAMGGLAARYDIANKMSMPSKSMGYAGGGMIQHYNVGGLTINTQPGQSEMEIARMAVNMMDAKNILNNTKRGIR